MSNILVLVGHPQTNSFCEALADRYVRGAGSAGHQVTKLALHSLSFDPILHEGYSRIQELEQDLKSAYRKIAACDHLVIVFPLWCGDMPALLKGFIERILQPDLIVRHGTEGAMNWRLFSNKTAEIIMTMGMPVSIYRYWYRSYALKLLKYNILKFIGITPVRDTLFGMVADVSLDKRNKWLNKAEKLGLTAK
jgi:putative NADPH-quinone reductase